ncbi:MAG: tautomerase family protein [Chloroflexota bacterium]|nr:MAG: tautomerase [Chloroflexota bacterium]
MPCIRIARGAAGGQRERLIAGVTTSLLVNEYGKNPQTAAVVIGEIESENREWNGEASRFAAHDGR